MPEGNSPEIPVPPQPPQEQPGLRQRAAQYVEDRLFHLMGRTNLPDRLTPPASTDQPAKETEEGKIVFRPVSVTRFGRHIGTHSTGAQEKSPQQVAYEAQLRQHLTASLPSLDVVRNFTPPDPYEARKKFEANFAQFQKHEAERNNG